tara:strand:- start:3141 stop:3533 length:393 start_codon:yes stop_codon:yes gene_type:complete
MKEDKKMKDWVHNEIKELKKNGSYYRKRGTSLVTIEKLEKKCEDQIIDKDKPIIFQRVCCGGREDEIFYTWEMWIDNGQIVISVDEVNGHYGKKAQAIEDRLDEKLRYELEDDYEEKLEIEQFERENGIK